MEDFIINMLLNLLSFSKDTIMSHVIQVHLQSIQSGQSSAKAITFVFGDMRIEWLLASMTTN